MDSSGRQSIGVGMENADPVLCSLHVLIFHHLTAVIQAFAGRVELSVVANIRTRDAVVETEFPPLSAEISRALAANIKHAARRDPYRTPQPGDTGDGGSVLTLPDVVLTTRPVESLPGYSCLFAVTPPNGERPGELFRIARMRTTRAVELAQTLCIAADIADGIAP